MKIFFFRIFLTILLVFLQLSFFDILFPWPQAPVFLFVAVVAWTLVLGFPRSLFMTVPLTLLFDSISYGEVTWFSLYAVLFAYGASFLSRRLLVEHRGWSLMLYAVFTALGVVIYQLGTPYIFKTEFFSGLVSSMPLPLIPSGDIIIFSLVFASLLFPLVYAVLKRFEAHIELMAQKQFLNVR